MDLLLIRHAEAEDRSVNDAARTLTAHGSEDMRRVASVLKRRCPRIDVLASSPLVRARQTAEIIAEVCGVTNITEQPLLAPGASAATLLPWLQAQPLTATIALVGHEPDLSGLASFFLAGEQLSFISFAKGACAYMEFAKKPGPACGALLWLLRPELLRA